MIDAKLFDDLSERIINNLPASLVTLQEDLKKNIRSAVEAGLGELNLVTREEFDIQTRVLARTRARLEQLEQQIGAMEAKQEK